MTENIHEALHKQPIKGFTSMSKDALEALAKELALHMSPRDLTYCQNQFRLRERRDPSVEELALLDALWVRRTHRTEHHGLRTFYTSDPLIAETYADLVAKASHLRRENRPYTPNELSGVLTRTLVQAGKQPSVPTLCAGKDAALRLLADGYTGNESAVMTNIPAMIGHAISRKTNIRNLPQPSDQLLLLLPSGLSPAVFASMVAALPLPESAQIVNIGSKGLFEALLTWDGVYLVQEYLPDLPAGAPLSALMTLYEDGLLIRIDGEQALTLRDAAASAGLTASIIGKWMPNNRLTVRRDGKAPWQIETAFLKAFSPTLPADAEIPGLCMQAADKSITEVSQTLVPHGDCILYATAIPGTPCSVQNAHVLSAACSHITDNTFRSALLASLYAVNRTVATGIDYTTLTLSNHIFTPHTANRNLDMGQTMAALLGVYRVQAELGLPDIGGRFADSPDESAHLTVFTAAPKPEKVIPQQFDCVGNNVYLLMPLATETSPVDFEDMRKLLRYVHKLCKDGIACSAIAVGEDGVENALHVMAHGGIGVSTTSPFPKAVCGFIIETKQVIQGQLIGITSAIPALRVGERAIPTVSFKLPPIAQDQIPMSKMGTSAPIVCLPQTCELGNIAVVQTLVKKHHGILKTVPLNNPTSRAQLTEFANALAQAQLTVLVGSGPQLEQILSNIRVSYAKQRMTERGGLLLCLHTDMAPAKNAPIPPQHPLFFGVPASLIERAAISFANEDGSEVHMRAESLAIPRMLACGIAYFR